MLAINRRFQHWLSMCKRTTVLQSQVNNRVFQINSIMEDILNGQFNMLLPPSFKKIKGTLKKVNHDIPAIGGGGKGGPEQDRHRKRKIDQEFAGSIVRNDAQCQEFIMKSSETWDKHFQSQCLKKRADWNEDVNMCAGCHIKGNCYDTCPRAISHVPCNKVPTKQKTDFLTFVGGGAESVLQSTRKIDTSGWGPIGIRPPDKPPERDVLKSIPLPFDFKFKSLSSQMIPKPLPQGPLSDLGLPRRVSWGTTTEPEGPSPWLPSTTTTVAKRPETAKQKARH